jgi:hypothetical protein
MVSFREFEQAAPEVAEAFRERLGATGLTVVGTVRRDGSPRVSPVEALLVDDRLFMGMMPASVKARDLQRDPRLCLITTLADKDDLSGEVKLHGTARELGTDERRVLSLAVHADRGLDPDELGDYHGFEVSVEEAAWQRVVGAAMVIVSWRAGESVRRRRRVGAAGQVEDLPADR